MGVRNTHAFGQALQATHVTRTKFAALKQAMASSCYGVIKGHRSVRLETAAMATLRFGAEGRREVVVALATDIVNFLRNEEKQQRPADAEEAEPITTNAAAHWMTHLSQDSLDSFLASSPGKIWHGELAPHQTLMLSRKFRSYFVFA